MFQKKHQSWSYSNTFSLLSQYSYYLSPFPAALGLLIKYVCKIFRKTNISYPTNVCVSEVKKMWKFSKFFSQNVVHVLNGPFTFYENAIPTQYIF